MFVPGDAASLTAGRLTLDLGSRRLVARQESRNTVNAFTGLDLQWTSPRHDVVRTFAVMPVVRLPSGPAELNDNRAELDRKNTDALFWAAFFQSRPLNARVTLEAYVLGLYERDSDIAPSSNRRLLTPGLRTLRPPAPGELDFQLEFMGQFGRSRASAAATDTADLEHLALSLHASSGFQFEVPWSPRVALQYDYASGDRAPDSNTNNRFDPLFCARRFDFGPVGLYGAIARSNMSSPGLRVEVRPHRMLDALAAYRLAWLASPRDGWTTAALRDPSGASGSFVGQQAETRVRWHMLPRNLSRGRQRSPRPRHVRNASPERSKRYPRVRLHADHRNDLAMATPLGRRALLRFAITMVAAGLLAPPAGCKRSEAASPPRENRLVVFAAASLRDVFSSIGKDFRRLHPGVELTFNFAGAQELRTQLEHGAAADVFASADRRHMDKLVRAGLAALPVVFTRNEPVLIVATEAAGTVRSFGDLPKAARIVVGTPEVPIGQYTLKILERAQATLGPDFRARVEARVVSFELNVRQVLTKVSLGEAQAGVVYRTDARSARDRVTVVPIASDINVIADYPIAVVTGTVHPVLARAWVDYVLSAAGQRALRDAGFLAPVNGSAS